MLNTQSWRRILARLSMWKNGKHSADYKFLDRVVSEQYMVAGTGILVHKYLGPKENTGSTDPTLPVNANASEKNIEDLLFLENRDRKYDPDVYAMRGHYTVADTSFDLSQFGLFLQTGTLFMTFHINDMVQTIGRKLMNGDVLELMHLMDYNSLDTSTPVALKRFFVCSDAQFASEGFSPTWWPHTWRVKINPMTDAQEFKDILNNVAANDENPTPIGQILSTIDIFQNINDVIIQQAEKDVGRSGYDTTGLYIKTDKTPDQPIESPTDKVHGYLTDDGLPPNATTVAAGISFPADPDSGDYYLRLDYVPNRLFRYDGRRWVKIEDNVRTNLNNGAEDNTTLRNSFVNDTSTFTNKSGETQKTLQNLNTLLKPKADI